MSVRRQGILGRSERENYRATEQTNAERKDCLCEMQGRRGYIQAIAGREACINVGGRDKGRRHGAY